MTSSKLRGTADHLIDTERVGRQMVATLRARGWLAEEPEDPFT